MHKSIVAIISLASLAAFACGSNAGSDNNTQKKPSAAPDGGAAEPSSASSSTQKDDASAGKTQDSSAAAGHAAQTTQGTAGKAAQTEKSTPMNGAAGADASTSDPIPSDTALPNLPDEFADAICGALLACLGPSTLREVTDGEACMKRVVAQLRATEFAYIDEAVTNGRVAYDSTALPACADGIRALGCDVLSHGYPEACARVLAGQVATDGECTISAECKGAAYCAGAEQCPSHCAPRLAEGETCTGDNQCGDDLMCVAGACLRPSLAGEPCKGTSGKICRIGLSCQGSTDVDSGHCVENAMLLVGDDGAVCEPGGKLCKEGLSCVFDGSSAFHCESAVGSGEKCHLGLPGQCPADEYCGATEVTAQSTCKALPTDGKPCVLSSSCAPGLACVSEASAHVCRPIADNCGACSAASACRSGRCEQGVCLPPPACGEALPCK